MRLHRRFLFSISVLAILLGTQISVFAINLGTDRLRLRGFGTLAVTDSGDGQLYYPTYLSSEPVYDKNPSLGESLLGLQLDGTLIDSLEADVQLVFRDRYDDAFEESLERAFLRYTNDAFMIRAGRLGLDIYMLSEYRNVGFAYLWARPPMEFYGAFNFDYFDGAEIGYTYHLPKGSLQARLYGGSSTASSSTKDESVELTVKPFIGGTLIWEHDSISVRLGLARGRFESEDFFTSGLRSTLKAAAHLGWTAAADIAEGFKLEDTLVQYFSAGISYDAHPWIIQSEISYADIERDIWQSLISGYISIGYAIGPVTIYTVGGAIWPAQDRQQVPQAPAGFEILQAAAQAAFDASAIEQKSISFGARWDMTANMALKAQWDHTWVKEYGGALWYKDTVNTQSLTVDTFSLNLSFIF